jgi:hypothetical protein
VSPANMVIDRHAPEPTVQLVRGVLIAYISFRLLSFCLLGRFRFDAGAP